MMRAIRFATQLGFRIHQPTFEAIKRNASGMEIITKERINDELGKIMRSAKPSVGFLLLEMSGILPLIMPELCALKGVETKEGRGARIISATRSRRSTMSPQSPKTNGSGGRRCSTT